MENENKKEKLGEILVKRGKANLQQLNEALEIQKKEKKMVGEILVQLGYVAEIDIVVALILQCGIPYIAIKKYTIDKKVLEMIPGEIAREFHVVPLDMVGNVLSVVMLDPLNETIKSTLAQMTNCKIAVFIATKSEIDEAIVKNYQK